jgi:hypothetical protein
MVVPKAGTLVQIGPGAIQSIISWILLMSEPNTCSQTLDLLKTYSNLSEINP